MVPAFLHDNSDIDNLVLVPLPSLKLACIDEIFWSSLLLILLIMILRSILLAWEMRLMVR